MRIQWLAAERSRVTNVEIRLADSVQASSDRAAAANISQDRPDPAFGTRPSR